MIGGKWKARILWLVSLAPATFSDLRKALPRVSREVLSTQLQSLIDDGIVEKSTAGTTADTTSVYYLTVRGRSLLHVLDTIAAWGNERLKEKGYVWHAPAAPDHPQRCLVGAEP